MRIGGFQAAMVMHMDGNSDIQSQVRLMRSVIGRKVMEIDEFNDKSAAATGDEAVMYANLVNFLEHDIAGYKTIIDDLKDGSCDYTGDLYEIASLPAEAVDLYNDFYVPSLSPEDKADEQAAMALKGQYAVDFVKKYTAQLGRAALANQVALQIMMDDEAVAQAIGAIVAGNPELLNAVAPEKQ